MPRPRTSLVGACGGRNIRLCAHPNDADRLARRGVASRRAAARGVAADAGLVGPRYFWYFALPSRCIKHSTSMAGRALPLEAAFGPPGFDMTRFIFITGGVVSSLG